MRRYLLAALAALALGVPAWADFQCVDNSPCVGPSGFTLSSGLLLRTAAVADLATPNQAGNLQLQTTWNGATTNTGLAYGLYSFLGVNNTITNPGHSVAILGQIQANAAGKTMDLAVGVEGKHTHLAGTLTNAIGVLGVMTSNAATVTNWGGIYSQITANSATITNSYMHAANLVANSGTITNYYAYFNNDASAITGITNRWAFYNADATAAVYTASNAITGTASRTFNLSAGTTYSVAALSAVSNHFVTGLGTDGILTHAQPAFTNISGTVTPAQGGFGADASSIAKGGLVVGSGAGTFGITTVGGDGAFLVGSSGAANGVAWANKVGGSGSAPVVSACGASPTVVTGNDFKGRLTTGSGGTVQSCTITFSAAFLGKPSCVCNSETSILNVRATATTTTLVCDSAAAGTLASDAINYICAGN